MAKRPNKVKRDYSKLLNTKESKPLPSLDEVKNGIAKITGATEEPLEKKGKGRKPLAVKRVPLTTSLTEKNKQQLRIFAARKGVRISDALNEILEVYFSNIDLE